MGAPWWERYPERYQSELDELASANIRYERDDEAFAAGILRLRVYPVIDGQELALSATFPELYPFFKFEVDAPTLDLPRHQHGASKTLCLLPRGTENWRPGSDRLARVLTEQLPLVLKTASSDDVSSFAAIEEHQAEPYTDYYSYAPGSFLLIDSRWSIPSDVAGGILIKLRCESVPVVRGDQAPLLRGAVAEILDPNGITLAAADDAVVRRFPAPLRTTWIRLKQPPKPGNPAAVFDEIASSDAGRRHSGIALSGGLLYVRAAVFPEEHRWRGTGPSHGDGWLFALRLDRPIGRKHGRQRAYRHITYLVRASRYGPDDIRARIPALGSLRDRRIAIFGLGCLGAASALEFARAGVRELRLIDYDYVDPATTVRWPIGLSAAGHLKTHALETFTAAEYPHTAVHVYSIRVGGVRDHATGELDILDTALDGVSLVYDATAEYGVQYFVSGLALARGIAYVGVESTLGAWGGKITRIVPVSTEGCWECAQHARIDGQIPTPPADSTAGDVQPEGCANPTFTGANFDTGEVVLAGVRAAVAHLTHAGGPVEGWDVAVLALRDELGRPIPPSWRTFPLARHSGCETCRDRNLL